MLLLKRKHGILRSSFSTQFRGAASANNKRLKDDEYKNSFKALGLEDTSTQDEVREAFLNLAKKHHPDSRNKEADAGKFHQIENAYRSLQEKFEMEKELAKSPVNGGLDQMNSSSADFDIEHTAPQHRQYLNFDGIGQGSPFQRQKQYQKHQVKKAVESVYNHRVSQITNMDEHALVYKDAKASKKIKTKYGIDRLVEDLIQESMSKGEFTNLKGSGKPLEYQNHNPFVDIVTHKINQVLIDNGFSPQWIMLEKEIRSEIQLLKDKLKEGRARVGALPLDPTDEDSWNKHLASLADDVKSINKKISDYNLVVPLLNKQMVHANLNRLSDKCLKEESFRTGPRESQPLSVSNRPSTSNSNVLLDLFNAVWKHA